MFSGYKTVVFNVLVIIAGVLALPELYAVVPVIWVPYLMLVAAVMNLIIRHFTNGKVFYKRN